ncbi:symporter [Myxococcaceae bacterium GXIMD 01537]
MEVIRQVVQFMVSHLVTAMAFALGLSLDARALATGVRQQAFARGLAVSLLAVPLLTVLVVKVTPMRPEAAFVILLMAFSPGLPILIQRVRRMAGNVPVALALSVTLSLLAILLMPVSLWVIHHVFVVDLRAPPPQHLLTTVFLPFVVPLVLGALLRMWWPTFARRLEPFASAIFMAAFLCAVVLALLLGVQRLRLASPIVALALVLITWMSALVGYTAGGPQPENRRTLSLAAVFGNPAIVLAVVAANYPEKKLFVDVCAYLLVRSLALLPFQLWFWRASHHRQGSPPKSGPRIPAEA